MLNPEPVAICGIGLRLPGGIETPTSLYNFLVNRRDARSTPDKPRYNSQNHHFAASGTSRPLPTEEGYWLTHDDVTKFDPSLFSMNPKELSKLDPQQRLLLQVVWEALESAAEIHWQGQRIGCYVGSFGDDWREMHAVDAQDDGMYRLTGYMDFVQANRISHAFDLRGPSMTVRTACSAAGLAVHLACQAIRAGECDSAVVAGSNLMLSPGFTKLMAEQSVLSPDASCKTFDSSANGYARAEAVNCLFIKKLDSAIRDGNPIRAVIRGSATNSDGKTIGLTTPSAQAQQQLIRDAYRNAGIPESDMWQTAMIECHGTGTTVGDSIEACTIGTVFGEKGMFIGSVKPNLGHSEAASAITSIVKAVLSLETRTIMPNIKFDNPSIRSILPRVPFESAGLKVPIEHTPWPDDRAERIGVNSFGIGGTNVHIIIDSAASVSHLTAVQGPGNVDTPPPSPPLRKEPATLLLFSAANEESLKKVVQNYKTFIHAKQLKLEELAHTLIHRRSHLAYRTFAIVTDECGTPTLNFPPALSFRSNTQSEDIAFIFTGQGAQWARMGSQLMKTSKEFLQDVREMNAALSCLPKEHQPAWDISRELMRSDVGSRLGEAEFAQPVCTALQIALVRHLLRYGVTPKAVLGHSSGEIAAAYAAGVLTLKEAIIVAYYRGYMVKKLGNSGAMAAVGLGRDQVAPFLVTGVSIGCENSNSSVTLSGDIDTLKSVCEAIKLTKPETLVRPLKVNTAYHSHHMRTIGAEPKPPRVAFYSSVSADTHQRGSDFGAEYWQRNLDSPVLFRQAMTKLLQTSSTKLHLEIGPHSALAGPLKQIYSENSVSPPYVSVQKRGSNSLTAFLSAVGELHCRGFPIKFPLLGGVRPLTDLPAYPWNMSKTYWPHSRSMNDWRFPTDPPHELLGSRVLGASETEPSWRCLLSLDRVTWIRDHCIGSDIVFPAAGFIAMAGEAVRQLSKNTSFTAQKAHVMNALIFQPGQTIELLTSARRERLTDTEMTNWWQLTVQSYSAADTWTTHFTCYIKEFPVLERDSFLKVTQPSQWYKAMSRVGYNYGQHFKGMRTIRASVTSSAVEVEVSECGTTGSSTQSYAMHPIAIDHVIQSLLVANSSGEPRILDKLYLPTHIAEIYIRGEPASGGLLIQTVKIGRKDHCYGHSTGMKPGDSSGRPTIVMKGLRFKPIEIIDPTESKPRVSKMTQMVWEPDVDLLDSVKLIHSTSSPDFPKIHQLLEELCVLCGSLVLQEVREVDYSSPETHTHLERHYDWLKKHINKSSKSRSTLTVDEIQDRINRISLELEKTPASAVGTLIKRCYAHAQSLYNSQMGPLEVFLKDNALHDLYDWMNSLFTYKPLLRLLSHKRGRHLRILEIGAGTGGLTARILKHLTDCFDAGKVLGKYVFTDVSAGFFHAARSRFESIPEGFIDYRVLDISRDPGDQGFSSERYDLIVASNVLHATPNLTKTLQHVRRLMKPEGILLMHELCCGKKPQKAVQGRILRINQVETKWINFIMGFLPGWWFGDCDGRSEQPYISPEEWENRLVAAGFSKPDVIYDAEQQHRLNATLVTRPLPSAVKSTTAFKNITILCEEMSHSVVVNLRDVLQNQGYSVACTTLSAEPVGSHSTVVSVIDLCREEGYFYNMTQRNLDAFKRLLRNLQEKNIRLVWITRPCQINPVDPTYAPY
ncbi:highly reducing polyketide synthase FUM1 [Colletotrichum liriopes]|uniref:Highly reducing polyketide synthase FUM1 n=1 Tax=Colletotrichum liriopes TaxID=708192 RepID=A0AA37LWY2_9PEZI|nr:highly reducing polyketide synthase FUM1 [Colletotrichum liriopes]